MDEPTDDPIRIVKNAKALLGSIYRKGYAYKKAGVLLLDLIPGRTRQALLFEEHGDELCAWFCRRPRRSTPPVTANQERFWPPKESGVPGA